MEILVGQSYTPGSSKAIVFPETNECFLRNFTWRDKLMERLEGITFLSEISHLIDHENLHLILHELGEEEACTTLNRIDGFNGYLLSRRKVCFGCRKKIEDPPYTIHLLVYWHKKCLEAFKSTPEYSTLHGLIEKEEFET